MMNYLLNTLSSHTFTNHFNKSQPSCICLFDYKNDKVKHKGLISKFLSFWQSITYFRFTFNFFTNHLDYISINFSFPHSITSILLFLKDPLYHHDYTYYFFPHSLLHLNIQLFQDTDAAAFSACIETIENINRRMSEAINTFTL